MENLIWIAPILAVIALIFAGIKTAKVSRADAGNPRMKEIAASISDGARAFLFSWPVAMTKWVQPLSQGFFHVSMADAVTGATPLAVMGPGSLPENVTLMQTFIGCVGGSSA